MPECHEVGAPIARWRPGEVDLPGRRIGHELQQLVAGLDVPVERRGPGSDGSGHLAHGDGSEAASVGQLHRGGGDPRPAVLGRGPSARPFLAQPDALGHPASFAPYYEHWLQ
jgi:hypothetical protein